MIAANYILPPALQVMPNPIFGIVVPGQEFPSTINVSYNREGEMKVLSAIASDSAIKTVVAPRRPTTSGIPRSR